MFIITRKCKCYGFIRSISTGYLKSKEKVFICVLEYDSKYYRDSLYSDYAVPFYEDFSLTAVKRRADFLAGRIATQILLNEQGNQSVVGVWSDKSPRWPSGWCGSITHTDKHAIAVIARKSEGLLLGVDIEKFKPKLLESITDGFLTCPEKTMLNNSAMTYHIALLISFSAKESLFKAIYPAVRKYFSFKDSTIVSIDINKQLFNLKLSNQLSKKLATDRLYTGNYIIYDKNVITLIVADAINQDS